MRGFTLIEMVILILVTGIIAGVTAWMLRSPDNINIELAVKKVSFDLSYVRERATASSRTHKVYLDAPDRLRAGFGNYTLLVNPDTNQPFDVSLQRSYPGVAILGNYSVGFDGLGRGIFKTQTSLLLGEGAATKRVKIIPQTGRVYAP